MNHAWAQFYHRQLEKAFCTLQTIFETVILCNGGNVYKIPHLGKDAIWNRDGVHTLREWASQASQEAVDVVNQIFGE